MKLRSFHITFFFWLALLLTGFQGLAQYNIPGIPDKGEDQIVYDEILLLNENQKNTLVTKLRNYADTTSTQIVIAIIGSTNGEDISLLGAKWGNQWGVGQAKEDNGIFILLARNDRTIDINTGYGIEYRMTDLTTERIINRVIIPEFKRGDYFEGLNKGTDAIFQALNGEFVAENEVKLISDSEWGILRNVIFFIVLYVIFLITIAVKSKGGGSGYGSGSTTYSSSGSSSSSYSSSSYSSSSSSSSSSSFGGGSFGGGGASGSW